MEREEEALQITVPLLRTGHVDFEGKYYQARDCELRPCGPRPGGPPIMIGAKGPRMLRLAATYADLWNAEGPLHRPEEIVPLRASGDAACFSVGRDPIGVHLRPPQATRKGWPYERRGVRAACGAPYRVGPPLAGGLPGARTGLSERLWGVTLPRSVAVLPS